MRLAFDPQAHGPEEARGAHSLLQSALCGSALGPTAATIVDEASGETAGLKAATVLVRGLYAYGWLHREAGVHRLVRNSPFDAAVRVRLDGRASRACWLRRFHPFSGLHGGPPRSDGAIRRLHPCRCIPPHPQSCQTTTETRLPSLLRWRQAISAWMSTAPRVRAVSTSTRPRAPCASSTSRPV